MAYTLTELKGRTTHIDDKGEWSGVRIFQVESDTQLYGFEAVTDLPALGEVYPGDFGYPIYCTSVDAQEIERHTDGWLWTVTCAYGVRGMSTDNDGGAEQSWSTNPLSRPPIYSWPQANQVEDYCTKDLAGGWFCNSNGEFFDPPLPLVRTLPILQVRRNYATDFWGPEQVTYYNNAYNATKYKGVEKHKARIASISVGEPMCENNIWYAEGIILVEFTSLTYGWRYEPVLNEGMKYRNADGDLVHATDSEGDKSTQTVALQQDGTRVVDPENPPVGSAAINALPYYIILFETRIGVNFEQLGI